MAAVGHAAYEGIVEECGMAGWSGRRQGPRRMTDGKGHVSEGDLPDELVSDEERSRYRELLEELRTILPGVQVLFAFLLTAPFSRRFTELDEFGRDLYGVALIGVALATIIFLAPTSYHRVAPRRLRANRLRTAIRLTVAGMFVLAVSVLVAVFAVVRFVFGSGVATLTVSALAGILVTLWYLVPLYRRLRGDGGHQG
jgi:hypothetical protein